ncbi:salicylate synthase [Amycolatopsis cihanbeyliensis]
MIPPGYVERRVPFEFDPLTAVTALAAGSGEAHVVYEGAGTACLAEGELATVRVHADGATLSTGGRRREFPAPGTPLDGAGAALRDVPVPHWRAYGWACFELSHALNGAPGPARDSTLAHLAVPEREIRIGAGSALLRATSGAELDVLQQRLADAVPGESESGSRQRLDVDVAGYGGAEYRAAVDTAVADIRAGGLDKVILSRTVPVSAEIDLPATYLEGRRGNDPARSFLLRLGGWEATGFSPEIVVHIGPDGQVTTQPLAGTRALDGNAVFDIARREELYRDAKEVFEHAISVRLAATELATVCEPGSVRVADFMSVKERGSVQHLASEVSGRLAGACSPWDALAALFPAVTASGIPKASACEVIRRTEPERGLYSGAVLTADADGTLDAALVLRSVYRRGGRTWLRAGAGIVAQSAPDRELEETEEKLRSVSRFLVRAPAYRGAAVVAS